MYRNRKYVSGKFDFSLPVKINSGEYVLKQLLEHKHKKLIDGATKESVTYGEIAQQAMNFAVSLTLMGAERGDVVALCSENCLEFWPAVIGTMCAGATLSPVSWSYTSGEINHILNIGKPKYIVCSSMALGKHKKSFLDYNFRKIIVFGNEAPNGIALFNNLITPSNNGLKQNAIYEEFEVPTVLGQVDVVFILYSSGTTGLPKGVMVTHYNVLTSLSSFEQATPGPNDSTLLVTPWFHTMGLLNSLGILSIGKDLIFLPRFNVESYLDCIDEYKVTHLLVAPPILVSINKSTIKRDLTSVKIITSGAAPLLKETIEETNKKFPKGKIIQGYGMSEIVLAAIEDLDPDKAKAGGIGVPTPGTIIKVVDLNTREPLGPFKEGEICLKGPRVMKGYIKKEQSDDFDSEGFFKTGDIGFYDSDNYFFIVDRIKELIKYKGYQVPPAEIEAVLLQHAAVRDAGVVGVPDREAGEVPLAFVALQPGATASVEEIQKHVAEKLSNPKRLRGGVRFVNEIPKNPSGKILRRVLRDMLKGGKSKL